MIIDITEEENIMILGMIGFCKSYYDFLPIETKEGLNKLQSKLK